ncbi:MAG: hypothetical protein ACI8RZ_002896 [Myxococcota bacterium]|jgi:hypothetical protein
MEAAVILWLVMMACKTTDPGSSPTNEASLSADGLEAAVLETMGSVVALRWRQSVAGTAQATFSVTGEADRATPVVDAVVVVGENELLLLGLPFDADVTWSLTLIAEDGTTLTESGSLTTDALPEGLPEAEVLLSDEAGWDAGSPFVLTAMNGVGSGANRAWTFIIDRLGRVVWAQETPNQRTTLHARLSYDGTQILIDHNSFWAIFDGGEVSQVARVGIDGVIVETVDTPNLHHPFTELADGSLVWGASTGFYADEVIRKRTPDGTVTDLWSCEALLDALNVDAYCGSNTLFWNEADDTFLFSLYSVDTIIEVDHATGDTLRTFGHLPDSWAFDPEESAFWWQHGVHYTAEGTLLVSAKAGENATETVVREYTLDADSQTLTEVWSFGEGEGVYGSEMGEAHRLSGGNTLHNYGSTARIREATPDGVVVWDVAWAGGTYIGRSEVIADLYDLWE